MQWIVRIGVGLIALLVAAIVGASIWFWWMPVGVNNYINKVTFEQVLDSPETLTVLGLIDNTPLDFHSGKLSSFTKEQEEKTRKQLVRARRGLDRYGPDGLEGQELISWKIAATYLDDLVADAELEHNDYPINQISGVTIDLPQFLTDSHLIKNKKSVKRYLSRLEEFGRVLEEAKVRVEDYRDHGVVAPDFIIQKALVGMQTFIEGGVEVNPLLTSLGPKLDKLSDVSDVKKAGYLADAKTIIETKILPGYEALIDLHEELLLTANHDAGIWRIPNGEKAYEIALKQFTTMDYTAEQIHQIGLSEVARIEQEMDVILVQQGLTDGTVTSRIQQLMDDPTKRFPNTEEGRAEMLAYLVALNDDIMSVAGDYFTTLPSQPLEIVRIPEYAQDSAPGGYYQSPALDGSRPGRFYINQKNTADRPRWTLPTLMIHEGAPGHHFQISLAQGIEDVPFLRKVYPFTAYAEGWALYAERIAKTDMGLYDEDPLGDLGRLQAEMFRAVRLVVDTGLHAKRWSREEAIDYMIAKTGRTSADVTREIERYVVWPGQATSYKMGQLAILDMRSKAERELGDEFDLREFHDVLLSSGSMPLGVLEEVVDAWIAEQKVR